jgi:DNA-binding NtrC family response regulator
MGRAVERPLLGRILVLEDDAAVRFGIVAALRARGYDVLEADTCAGAHELFAARPDVVITDLRLPDGDAVGLIPRLRAIDPSVVVYVITGFATIDVAVRTVKLGAEEFFTKPVEISTILRCIETALARRQTNQSGQRRRYAGELPGGAVEFRSEAMRRLEDEIERLRNSDCTVLILGETGTGKSRLARRLHDLGARSRGPFVDVNCAGLSRDFVESELFGHERGAFTGAHAPKQGLFDAADGGTLFLDEIGDIDVQVQPKILKVLEERRFRRMGDVRERNADVRLIAATHHDLLTAVEGRTFRADLFYRISTVTLRMPSLRERTSDLPPMLNEMLAQEGGGATLTAAAWDKIASYSWPGNIRELKNVIQRALLLRRGEEISADDIRFDSDVRPSGTLRAMPRLATEPTLTPTPEKMATPITARADVKPSTLGEMEQIHIRRALAAENGRVKDAALRLGIPRSTLYQKIKNYGIQLPFRDAPPSSSRPPGESSES